MNNINMEVQLKRKDGTEKTFKITSPKEGDVQEIMALQNAVYQGLEDKSVFIITEGDCILDSIREDVCISAYCDNKLVGFSLMVSPRISDRNYGEFLNYTDEKLLRCVSMDTSFIDSDYRGFGLQELFFDIRDEKALEFNAAEALVTISPNNSYSLNNALKNGFKEILRFEIKGLERSLLRKEYIDR